MNILDLYNSKTHCGLDKKERYNWVTKDDPGSLRYIPKEDLKIHPGYQREIIQPKVAELTATWSWIGCGVIVVGERDNQFWVIDGQHRVIASLRRSDIDNLPCIVFQTDNIMQEAIGFLDANAKRKPVNAIGKWKALLVSEDETALFVEMVLTKLNISIVKNTWSTRQLKCIGWCLKRAKENKERFVNILELVSDLTERDGIPIPERILEAIWIIDSIIPNGLHDPRLKKRIQEKGATVLLSAINRACAFYTTGGGRIWAEGVLTELNKGLTKKFEPI